MTELWLDAREYDKEKVTAALERGYDKIWCEPNKVDEVKKLGEIDVASKEKADITLKEPKQKSDLPQGEEKEVGAFVLIRNKQDEEFAKELGSQVDYLLIRTTDWEIIPLENLIADLQKKDTELILGINEVSDAETALNTLEVGVDGLFFDPSSLNELSDLVQELNSLEKKSFDLTEVEVTEIKEVGLGDRVCVDTSNLMEVGEGMLVGSSSKGLFLVHSESLDTEYADPRPFRVNAGGVHNYLQVNVDETKYLSELEAGDEVLVIDSDGGARDAFVGRSKIEKRPMMLIKARTNDSIIKVVLQNAETICLVDSSGKPVSLSDLEPGDCVLAKTEKSGRHFGEEIEETIVEK